MNKNLLNEIARMREMAGVKTNRNDKEDILKSIINAWDYKFYVLDTKTPKEKLKPSLKKYTIEDYNNDLNKLRNFDINLLWDKSFWGIGVSSSVSAVAGPYYGKLQSLLRTNTTPNN